MRGGQLRWVRYDQSITVPAEVAGPVVPVGRRWTVYAISTGRVSGDFTYSTFNVIDRNGQGGGLKVHSPEVGTHAEIFNQPLILEQGWRLGANVGTVTTGGVGVVMALVVEEASHE